DHRVDRVFESEDFALHVDRDLFRQVAAGDCGGDVRDVAHLAGGVVSHKVEVLGHVLPRAGDAAHLRLPSQLAFGAHLTRHTRHLGSERVELVDHGVDGVLQLKDLAFDVDGNLLGEVARGDGGGHFGDVAHLASQVGRHRVDVIGEILP